MLPLCAAAEGAPGAAGSQGGIGTGQIVSWLFSTLAVVAFILVLAYIVKKTRVRMAGGGQSRVLSQIPVGPKERIAEVRIAGRRLIVGVTAQNITLLSDLGPDGGSEFAGRLDEARRAGDGNGEGGDGAGRA